MRSEHLFEVSKIRIVSVSLSGIAGVAKRLVVSDVILTTQRLGEDVVNLQIFLISRHPA